MNMRIFPRLSSCFPNIAESPRISYSNHGPHSCSINRRVPRSFKNRPSGSEFHSVSILEPIHSRLEILGF